MDKRKIKAHNISDSEDSNHGTCNQTSSQRDSFYDSDDLFVDDYDYSMIGSGSNSNAQQTDPVTGKTDGTNSSMKGKKTKSVTSKGACYDSDTDVDEPNEKRDGGEKQKPLCRYGSKCYRKNPSHLTEFSHPSTNNKRKSADNKIIEVPLKKSKSILPDVKKIVPSVSRFEEFQPYSFFLTKVSGIPKQFNDRGAMCLSDVLSPEMGELISSCHFNFLFDVPWVMKQYAECDRKLPVLLVHGEQGKAEMDLKGQGTPYPNVSFCKARLDIPYGTHHSKMMFLLYKTGLRVVIHTANLVQNDWHQKTQGIWISKIFPRCASPSEPGESPTRFKADLLQYVEAYKSTRLTFWEKAIKEHDLSSANVHIVASVPGRHALKSKYHWGHLKLKKVLSERGPDQGLVKNWPVVGQFSSIGSLGPNQDAWLLSEWGQSMSECKKALSLSSSLPASKLHLIFPTKDNIRLSLEGYNGGGCVPYSIRTASKQPWLTPLLSQWKSEGRGRSRAVPHIKSYTRCSPDGTQAAWFAVTSANLSKAAWGALEKKGSQLMIRSYEIGVLFLPADFGCKNSFTVNSRMEHVIDPDRKVFPLPYDLPPTTYVKGDRPWFCDVPCMDAPDTFGKMWCPPL